MSKKYQNKIRFYFLPIVYLLSFYYYTFMQKIYLSILIFIILIFISLPIVHIPITSSSRGVVRSFIENTNITSMVSGRVIRNNLKQNNQIIKKGDTLLIITAEQIETQKQLQGIQASDYYAQLDDLNKIVEGNFSLLQTGQYQREVSAMFENIAQIKSELELAEKDFYRTKTLYNQGVISQSEFDKDLFKVENIKKQISTIKEKHIAQWQADKREIERQIQVLNSEFKRLDQEAKNYIITSPISGRLINFHGIQQDSYIIQSQEIGTISPEEMIVIETYVSPKDIGFIYLGQKVKIQMDTYNYNQWGLLEGKVIQIDKNLTVNQQTGESFFRVLCSMDKTFLQLKNGYKGKIEKGMTLTTRFHLIDRTLWQLLFDHVDNLV